jgi:hypothetical protein
MIGNAQGMAEKGHEGDLSTVHVQEDDAPGDGKGKGHGSPPGTVGAEDASPPGGE